MRSTQTCMYHIRSCPCFYYHIRSCPCFYSLIVSFIVRKTINLEERYDFSPPIFTMYWEIARTALSMSSTEGAFIVSKNTSEGRGSPCAADLASRSACSFSTLGIFLTEKPSKEASYLRTVSRYFSSFGSLALLLLSIWPEMT
jgi:hypothetical protein